MSTLTINLNEEYRIKIENGNDFHNSIFKEVYIDAAKNVVEIINQSISKNKYDDFNNIIAFTGERGKGKSSSMISFRNALVNNTNLKHKDFFDAKKLDDISLNLNFEILRNKTFAEIDIIDPSLFKGNESLFEIILAKMFSKFQDKIKTQNFKISDDVRRNLISHFQKVFENLQIINSDREELYKLETIEALSKLATSSNLRECFKDLVTEYLNAFENKNFLIIAIDDFDLNVSGAYDMLEDIRQFLVQKNVVILVACKMEQLKESVKINILDEYSKLKIDEVKINNMSSKYIEKLFPFSRQINLPDLSYFITIPSIVINDEINDNDVEYIKEKVNSEENFIILKKDEEIIFTGSDVQDMVLEIIYKYTGVFVSKPKFTINSIVPQTLRELSNFIGSLHSSENKLLKFKNYLLNKAKNELDYKYYQVFEKLEKENYQLLNFLTLNLIGEHKEILLLNNLNYLLHPRNPLNVSVGDVFSLFRLIDKNSDFLKTELNNFTNLLEIYYSVRIKEIENNLENCNDFLLTGGLYNEYFDTFPKDNDSKTRRDWFVFSSEIIKKFEDKKEDLYWLSFFIPNLGKLTVDYRNSDENPFYKEFNHQGGQFESVQFSPFNIFSSILNPEKVWGILMKNDYLNNESELDLSINNWLRENHNNTTLFFNIFFFLEFIKRLEKRTKKFKDSSLGDFENTLSLYIINISNKVLNSIKDDYTFIKLEKNFLEKHPLIIYWNKNRESLKPLVNQIFESSKNLKDIKKNSDILITNDAIKITNEYIRNLPRRTNKKTSLSRFRKKLDELNVKPIELINLITKTRDSLDQPNVNVENLIDNLIEELKIKIELNG